MDHKLNYQALILPHVPGEELPWDDARDRLYALKADGYRSTYRSFHTPSGEWTFCVVVLGKESDPNPDEVLAVIYL